MGHVGSREAHGLKGPWVAVRMEYPKARWIGPTRAGNLGVHGDEASKGQLILVGLVVQQVTVADKPIFGWQVAGAPPRFRPWVEVPVTNQTPNGNYRGALNRGW